MGECAYFLKAAFLTEAAAKKAEPELNAFFLEAQDAYWLWQDSPLKGKAFWKEYATKFPRMMEYAQIIGAKDRSDLYRKCDFGSEGDQVGREGNVLTWWAEVGHMSEWTPLAESRKNMVPPESSMTPRKMAAGVWNHSSSMSTKISSPTS
jgi:hypothetical protein